MFLAEYEDMGTQDGMTWLLNPPEQNLPLILAENGFDVWIANARGTRYSRKHISLDPSKPVCHSFFGCYCSIHT